MEQVKIFQPAGTLDGTKASQLRREINDAVSAGVKTVLIDLENLTFMDSSGLGALVSALKTVRSAGGKLCICCVNNQVGMLFELTSMNRVFEIYPTQAEFEQAVLPQT